MFAFSFRIKLLLAMTALVAGVASSILYATHEKVQATYLKLFQDQFETEVNYFVLQQENRLNPDKDRCEELARLPAFRDALKSGRLTRFTKWRWIFSASNRSKISGGAIRFARHPAVEWRWWQWWRGVPHEPIFPRSQRQRRNSASR